jgi:hypothetical protein
VALAGEDPYYRRAVGFHTQPNDWTCGPFALKHALITLGRLESTEELARAAGTHWWTGTDEIGLAKAARRQDCLLPMQRKRRGDVARKELVHFLKKRLPVLLCVDDWGHWITVVGREKDSFVVIDSLLDPVIHVLSWRELWRRWRYLDHDYDEDDPPELYEMYPLTPRFKPQIQANFSVARIRHLRRPENRALAKDWNAYLSDLLEICRPPDARRLRKISMAELLRRNQSLIVSRVLYWHGDIERAAILRLLGNFRFVAETYGLVIPDANVRRAVADLAILTTMWVIASRGIGELYGAGPR